MCRSSGCTGLLAAQALAGATARARRARGEISLFDLPYPRRRGARADVTGVALIAAMGMLGLIMRLTQATVIHLSPARFYRLLTLHGVGLITGSLLAMMGASGLCRTQASRCGRREGLPPGTAAETQTLYGSGRHRFNARPGGCLGASLAGAAAIVPVIGFFAVTVIVSPRRVISSGAPPRAASSEPVEVRPRPSAAARVRRDPRSGFRSSVGVLGLTSRCTGALLRPVASCQVLRAIRLRRP